MEYNGIHVLRHVQLVRSLSLANSKRDRTSFGVAIVGDRSDRGQSAMFSSCDHRSRVLLQKFKITTKFGGVKDSLLEVKPVLPAV